MSFMFRVRRETDFDYGSTFCPYKDGCSAHNCFNCRVFQSENNNKNFQLENFYAGGLK